MSTELQSLEPNELIQRASRAYLAWHRRRCVYPGPYPSAADSYVEGDVIVLRNVSSELARYSINAQRLGRLAIREGGR